MCELGNCKEQSLVVVDSVRSIILSRLYTVRRWLFVDCVEVWGMKLYSAIRLLDYSSYSSLSAF